MEKVNKLPDSKDASPYFKNLSLNIKKPKTVDILLQSTHLMPEIEELRTCQSSMPQISNIIIKKMSNSKGMKEATESSHQ